MQNSSQPSRHAWLWPVAIAGLIFFASSQSKIAGPDVEGSDKVAHFAIYGLLATLTVRLRRGRVWAILSVLIASLYGVSDEYHQSFTPGRSVEAADWLADTLGGLLAVILYTQWTAYRALLERPLWQKRRIENVPTVTTDSP